MPKSPFFRLSTPLILLLAAVALAGCGRNKCVLELNDAFSVNIIEPPACFPEDIETLTSAQQEVYARYGRPDYIRYWWNPDGEFIGTSDLITIYDELKDTMETQRKSWVYYYDDMEIVFRPRDEGYDAPVKPTELVKIVCRYGDPSQKTEKMLMPNGLLKENWTYIDHGFTLEIVDGVVVNKTYFKSTGRGTIIGK